MREPYRTGMGRAMVGLTVIGGVNMDYRPKPARKIIKRCASLLWQKVTGGGAVQHPRSRKAVARVLLFLSRAK